MVLTVHGGVVLPRLREIQDISIPLEPRTPVWPGDPPFQAFPIQRIDRGEPYNLTELRFGTHTGTHIDAPLHVFREGSPAHRFPLEALCGPAWVLDIPCHDPIARRDVENAWNAARAQYREIRHREGMDEVWTRVLLKTRGSARWADHGTRHTGAPKGFLEEGFPGLAADAARFFVDRGVRLVGIDGPSIDADDERLPVHRLLLGADIAVLECIDLSRVESGPWFLCCLPLSVMDTDGAPARAILARS